jgi:hypothetical protein
MRNELINLRLINNTSSTIPSSLFGVVSTTTNTANSTTRYTWNFSFVSLTSGIANIIINSVSIPLQFNGTIQGLADVLNELNYGYFLVNGNTIYTQDDTNIYGTLTTPNNPLDPYIYGTPQLVFDFSATSYYQNSGSTIADLSGNGNDGVFVTQNLPPIPTTITGYSTNGYLNLPGTAAQLSVKLPDSLKPLGLAPFTYIVYMQPNGYSYNGNIPGIISNQYYNGVNGEGFSWDVTPIIPPNDFVSSRNQNIVVGLPFNGGGGFGQWSVYAVKFDGISTTTIYQYYNGVMYNASGINSNSIATPSFPTWSFYLGLRYNNWINAKFNYVGMYNTTLSDSDILTIASTLSQRTII